MQLRLSIKFSIIIPLLLFVGRSIHAQTTFQDSILHQGEYRKYIVRVPDAYTPNAPSDLVFLLHGGGGNATRMYFLTRFDIVADTANFILVFPQGAFSGNDDMGNPGYHWADGRRTTIPEVNGVDDVAFFASLIDHLSTSFNINDQRIYAAGVSNGGFMVQRLACELSDRFAAVATVAATFPDSLLQDCTSPFPTSILIMNGTTDLLVPTYTGGMNAGAGGWVLSTDDMIDVWINNNNCSNSFQTTEIPDTSNSDNSTVTKFLYLNCALNTEIAHYKIFNGGHAWPGQLFTGPFTGNSNNDINANQEIWRFFRGKTKQLVSSVSEAPTADEVVVFPNPFRDRLTIQAPADTPIRGVEVFDGLGRRVYSAKVDGNHQLTLEDLPELRSGIYLVWVLVDGGWILRSVIRDG